MLKSQINGLTAVKLRTILISSILLLIVLCIVGFWYFRTQLVSYSENVLLVRAAATISTDDIAKLKQLKTDLGKDVVAVTRAKNIVADGQTYKYQDQIINDVNVYAKSSGVSINGFTFNTASTAAGTPAAGAAQAAGTAPAGLKSVTASVDIKSPVNYQAIMKFIHALELNLTKLQLSGVSLQKSTTDPTQVTVSPLTIEVYTR